MTSFVSGIWNWISGKPVIPEIPPDIIFEKDVTPDNDFWISCILDPTMDIKYVNGIVTKIIDTDKCIINGLYHYQPKNEREIRNFPYIELNSSVRISLYKKKNCDSDNWKVASCFLSAEGPCHQANLIRQNDTIRVHLNSNEPTLEVSNTDEHDEESPMTVQVLGDMPKVINFEKESIIQILFKNNSYVKEQELLDYKTMLTTRAQLSIANKIQLPLIIGIQSQQIFDISIQGKYLGKSTEKVEFIFKDTTYKVGVNIDVIDSRIIIPYITGYNRKENIDLQRLFELQNDKIVPGIQPRKRIQFPSVRIPLFNIPFLLQKCYWNEDSKLIVRNDNEVIENITKFFPDVFKMLTYENYKAKFHSLLFMEEISVTISLQKYARERIHFDHNGEYLVLKIPDLSEQRPSLIPGDRARVTDPPNCSKRLGECGKYEGIIHKVLADEIWLKFDPEFHRICGHWDYSVDFFNTRMVYRRQHYMIDELWKNSKLGEIFLFPYKDSLHYQPSKLEILSLNEKNADTCGENLNENQTLLPKPKVIQKIRWFNGMLNKEQKTAVINILKGEGRPMPYIIYGPPGTGKTVTLTEAIIQVFKEFPKSKLLVCAPTNTAVDMLLGKLVDSGLFDKTVMKRIVSYSHYIGSNYNMDHDEYCVLPEIDDAYENYKEKNSKLINKKDILRLRIVLATEGTAGLLFMMGLKNGLFTHIFIDEAGQSTEPQILLPLAFLDPFNDGQVVLAGDPKQLGPVVLGTLAKRHGLGQSMLGRFINYPSYLRDPVIFPESNGYNPKVITHLVQNYRSLPEIVHLFSRLFYESLLVATKVDNDVKEKIMLNNLIENTHWNIIDCKGPIIVHGIEGEDRQEPSSPSWFNPHEAFQVFLYINILMKAGISTDDIGVITPYAAQVSKIIELFKTYHSDIKLPKVGTVEMFQGQERMVIIISIVRSKSRSAREKDNKFNIGFITANQRTNVALSRAKALLIIVGDPSTMLLNDKWKKILVNSIKKNNYTGCNVPEYDLEAGS